MKTKDLRSHLLKVQAVLTAVVIFIAWFFVTINDYYIFKKLSIQNFETTSRILSRNLTTCLAFKDQNECQRVLNTLSTEKNVIKAVIVNQAGKAFAEFARENSANHKHIFQFQDLQSFQYITEDNHIKTTVPVMEGNSLEGRLFIVGDLDLLETFGKRHAIVFVIILLGSILLAHRLAIQMQKKISLQIHALLTMMKKIREEKNYSLRMSNVTHENIQITEFNEIGDSFDEMIKQIEAKDKFLKDQNDQLEKLVQQKAQEVVKSAELASLGEMAGGIAHEINNPLTIIISSSSILLTLLEKDQFEKEFFIDYLSTIVTTVDRISVIIKSLRNISRNAENEKKSFSKLSLILDDVLGIALAKFKSKGIDFRKKYSDEVLNKSFMTNRIQLSQVLINLLNNSHDAIIDLKVKWVEVEINFDIEVGRVIIKVTDSGSGIPVEVRQKMFNPFYTTKDIGKGTGIGLSISKSIIEKMGGVLTYDESSKDTCFVLNLPTEA